MIGNYLVASTTAVDMGRVRTQQDRHALSSALYLWSQNVFYKKRESIHLLWFVAQTGVLNNTNAKRVEHYTMSFGYLDEAYIMVNYMLLVSRRFVPWTTKGAQIGTPYIQNVFLRFLSKYSMNQLSSNLIFISLIFPIQWCHHNWCLCFSWCALKTTTLQQSPVEKNAFQLWELSFFHLQEPISASVSILPPTLRTPT